MMELMHFPEQRPEEKIIMVIRKHFLVYLKLLFIFILIFVLPLVLIFPFFTYYFGESIGTNGVLIAKILACLYLLYGMAFLLVAWSREAFDLFILTDQRLIDITQVNFFKRSVATTSLDQIQDTTSHVNGFLGNIFNYGNVDVQTAGSSSSFFIDSIPRPDDVSRAILSQSQKDHGPHE